MSLAPEGAEAKQYQRRDTISSPQFFGAQARRVFACFFRGLGTTNHLNSAAACFLDF